MTSDSTPKGCRKIDGWITKDWDWMFTKPYNRLFGYLNFSWKTTITDIKTPNNPTKVRITIEEIDDKED